MKVRDISPQDVKSAQSGDRTALEAVLVGIQDRIHTLARRILVNPEDANEATQEILIQILTKLSTFRGESAFSTWAYSVAVRYLLSAKRIRERDMGLTFEIYAADLETGLVADPPEAPDQALMLNELRVSCTMAMLLCLSMDLRLAYVLGDVLEMDHVEASEVLELTPATYRKRLSRARTEVHGFTSRHCGLISDKAKCTCAKRLPAAIEMGRIRQGSFPNSMGSPLSYLDAKQQIEAVVDDLKTFKLQGTVPQHECPQEIRSQLTRILSPNL
ncbi:MAG: RNA polymerase sigma factor [Roseibium sp.]|uniref:RNA polymerase sigma factor n=1 Tax=Roseibium sp. TaxID=1936156 RepID=UPI00262BBCD7|nr:RNA polymerase sigma factor [Roseibium sp.]MCV0424117.1 RNA polymerase sigma factor [Roseibium sp.]